MTGDPDEFHAEAEERDMLQMWQEGPLCKTSVPMGTMMTRRQLDQV
jgi:predicted solute-binding protein